MPEVSDVSPSDILSVLITGNQDAPSSSGGHAILWTGIEGSQPGVATGGG